MREIFQNSSVIISIAMLLAIYYRVRHFQETARSWSPFILICVCVIIYYGFVFIDAHYFDIFDAGFWSSTVRLISQISLLLYVVYTHRRPTL